MSKRGSQIRTAVMHSSVYGDPSELERARGMIDLAVEAQYLSTVWHPISVRNLVVAGMGRYSGLLSESSRLT
jgi:hypothetical protein